MENNIQPISYILDLLQFILQQASNTSLWKKSIVLNYVNLKGISASFPSLSTLIVINILHISILVSAVVSINIYLKLLLLLLLSRKMIMVNMLIAMSILILMRTHMSELITASIITPLCRASSLFNLIQHWRPRPLIIQSRYLLMRI